MFVVCESCGKKFERSNGECKRSEKLGRKHFCSRTCFGKSNHAHLPKGIFDYNRDKLKRHDDGLGEFRWHIRNMKRRRVNRGIFLHPEITPDYLKSLWERQGGVCPYTGWKLFLRRYNDHDQHRQPTLASIDRIDSNRGYEPGNIQFISYAANLAKFEWPEDQFMNLCESVARHKGLVR